MTNDKKRTGEVWQDDGSVALSDNKNELTFGNKFTSPSWIL